MAALTGHYLIGVMLAVIYILAAGWLDILPGSVLFALVFGIATCIFPWFLVYPVPGFGMFGFRGLEELTLFITSFVNNIFCGFGQWWRAVFFNIR